ncbi:MAG: hypothetical protein IPM29_29395 [Planctomycetes bacterium]|nr:hypothetical protein [Planctomycetota bacterium]
MCRSPHLLLAALALVTSQHPAAQAPQVTVVGTGCGAAPPSLAMTAPVLGSTCWLRIDSLATVTTAVVIGSPAPAPWLLPGDCAVHVDVPGAVVHGVSSPGGRGLALPVPHALPLLGLPLAVQCVAWPTTAAAGFDVSNGVHAKVGLRQGPLAGLPSPAGPHLAAIAALGPDSWLDLGVPQPDPVHGLATGREYTPRMAWSATLQGAFLTGESGHGYVNPQTGRYVDDVWFYDLAGHAWRCVKAGSPVATLSLQLDAHRFEVDAQGRLVPTAQLGHGYELVTYDELHQLFFMQPLPNTYWVTSMPQRLGWLPDNDPGFPASQYRSPWLFDAIFGEWRRRPPGASPPDFNVAARAVAVHAIGGRIWVFDTSAANRARIWWFDPDTATWSAEATANQAPALTGNGISCLDEASGRVWYYGVEATSLQARMWSYDVGSRTWQTAIAAGTPPHSTIYVTAGRGLLHDARDDVVLLWIKSGSGAPVLHPYDVRTASWGTPSSPPAAMASLFTWRHLNAFHAADHDVHVFHVAPGDSGTGRIVAYRH